VRRKTSALLDLFDYLRKKYPGIGMVESRKTKSFRKFLDGVVKGCYVIDIHS